MQDYSQIQPDAERSATAHNMADAVGYLMRVAADAGLQNIAVKLANIRANLLNLANAQAQAGDVAHPLLEPAPGAYVKRRLDG